MAQHRSDRPVEPSAVRTTIVGGRPPGQGKRRAEAPRSHSDSPRLARDGARASGRSGGAADITLVNLNMLYMRYGEEIERELHVPLGCLYLTRALEQAGYTVDLRDYQTVASDDPFDMQVFLDFLSDPAPVIGLSCMANLLPFTVLAIRALRERYPDRRVLLGGVGAREILQYACGYARTGDGPVGRAIAAE